MSIADFTFTVPRIEDLAAPSPLPRRRKKTVRGPIAAELPIERIVAVIDTREQLPHDLAPLRMEVDTLKAGDYSVRGLENDVAIERKPLNDFLGCVGRDRERFEACVQRLLGYRTRAIVIEASQAEIEAGQWRSAITPAMALGAIYSWESRCVPVVFAGSRAGASRHVIGLLVSAARREWRRLREMAVAIERISEC